MDFTKSYSRREMFYFLVPLIAAEIFQQIYSLINTVVVGYVQDYKAVAVIGACSGILSIRNNLLSGMMYGFGIYLGKAVGSKDSIYFRRTLSAAFFYTLLLGVIGVLVIPWVGILLKTGNVPYELIYDAKWYLIIFLAGCGAIGLKLLFLVTLQAVGETYFFSFLAAAGVVINTVLVVLFVGVFKGGVSFSALATVLTDFLLAIFLFIHIYRKRRDILQMVGVREIETGIWIELFKNGCAKTAYFVLGSVGSLFLQRAINTFSIETIAGQTWAVRLQTILLAPSGEFGTASGVITGQNVGAKNMENISMYHKKLKRMMIVYGICAVLFVYLMGEPFLRLLSGAEKPPEVVKMAMNWLRITVLTFPVLFFILHRNALQAMGRYPQVVWLGVINMVVIMIASEIFVPLFGFQAAAVGVATGWILQSIAGAIFFISL